RLFLQARQARDQLAEALPQQAAERLQAIDARLTTIARALLRSGHFDQGDPEQPGPAPDPERTLQDK
ncbi:MAG: hypothetical protein ACOCXA_09315, partial [Planctomycetota bacterium]